MIQKKSRTQVRLFACLKERYPQPGMSVAEADGGQQTS